MSANVDWKSGTRIKKIQEKLEEKPKTIRFHAAKLHACCPAILTAR